MPSQRREAGGAGTGEPPGGASRTAPARSAPPAGAYPWFQRGLPASSSAASLATGSRTFCRKIIAAMA